MQDTIQITGLEPIIAPGPISFWPPAPGWYVVGAIILLMVLFGIYRLIKKHQRNRYRRLALQELNILVIDAKNLKMNQIIAALSALMKRTALAAYPRKKVAALSGKDWLQFLNKTCSATDFAQYPANLLGEAGYVLSKKGLEKNDFKTLVENCTVWVKKHRRKLL